MPQARPPGAGYYNWSLRWADDDLAAKREVCTIPWKASASGQSGPSVADASVAIARATSTVFASAYGVDRTSVKFRLLGSNTSGVSRTATVEAIAAGAGDGSDLSATTCSAAAVNLGSMQVNGDGTYTLNSTAAIPANYTTAMYGLRVTIAGDAINKPTTACGGSLDVAGLTRFVATTSASTVPFGGGVSVKLVRKGLTSGMTPGGSVDLPSLQPDIVIVPKALANSLNCTNAAAMYAAGLTRSLGDTQASNPAVGLATTRDRTPITAGAAWASPTYRTARLTSPSDRSQPAPAGQYQVLTHTFVDPATLDASVRAQQAPKTTSSGLVEEWTGCKDPSMTVTVSSSPSPITLTASASRVAGGDPEVTYNFPSSTTNGVAYLEIRQSAPVDSAPTSGGQRCPQVEGRPSIVRPAQAAGSLPTDGLDTPGAEPLMGQWVGYQIDAFAPSATDPTMHDLIFSNCTNYIQLHDEFPSRFSPKMEVGAFGASSTPTVTDGAVASEVSFGNTLGDMDRGKNGDLVFVSKPGGGASDLIWRLRGGRVTLIAGRIGAPAGTMQSNVSARTFPWPSIGAIAVDNFGNVFAGILDESKIYRIDASSGQVTHFAGNGDVPWAKFTVAGPARSTAVSARNFDIDYRGNLYAGETDIVVKIPTTEAQPQLSSQINYSSNTSGVHGISQVMTSDSGPGIYITHSLTVSGQGTTYVIERLNDDYPGAQIYSGSRSSAECKLDNVTSTSVQLCDFQSMASDSKGVVYAVAGRSLVKLSPDGTVARLGAAPGSGALGPQRDKPVSQALFSSVNARLESASNDELLVQVGRSYWRVTRG